MKRLVEDVAGPPGVSKSIYLTCIHNCENCPMNDMPQNLLEFSICYNHVWIPTRHLSASKPKRSQDIQTPDRQKALRLFLKELDLL